MRAKIGSDRPERPKSLYEADFHAWTAQQAAAIRARQWERLDIENLAEEIESLGRAERRELESRLAILVGHLLKWQFQSGRRSNSWQATIDEQRRQISRRLAAQPSLKAHLVEAFQEGRQAGLRLAVQQTDLPYGHFPVECPYSLEEALDPGFFPGTQSDPS
ncbi:DUF29 domain-containing protein [Gloeobacter violaceus]|uniref:DUF29 domain-containing protein n=1 Tax=Gloeobacter violaceus TaxID=33072 RepID=UPI0013E898DF|nr:DUF29 domain-containing protein [Gloeobacter violaceus]